MTAIQLRYRRYLKQTRSRPRSGRRRRQFSLHSCSPSWPFSGSKGSESMTRCQSAVPLGVAGSSKFVRPSSGTAFSTTPSASRSDV